MMGPSVAGMASALMVLPSGCEVRDVLDGLGVGGKPAPVRLRVRLRIPFQQERRDIGLRRDLVVHREKGLIGDVSLEGSKVTKLDK